MLIDAKEESDANKPRTLFDELKSLYVIFNDDANLISILALATIEIAEMINDVSKSAKMVETMGKYISMIPDENPYKEYVISALEEYYKHRNQNDDTTNI